MLQQVRFLSFKGTYMVKKSDLKLFALIWAGIFLLASVLPLIKGNPMRYWALIVALIFAVIAFVKPEILSRFYQVWMKVGTFIGGIVSKVMMSVLYFLVFTPIAFILRAMGKDMLNKKIDRSAKSYWVEREKQPESMKNQF